MPQQTLAVVVRPEAASIRARRVEHIEVAIRPTSVQREDYGGVERRIVEARQGVGSMVVHLDPRTLSVRLTGRGRGHRLLAAHDAAQSGSECLGLAGIAGPAGHWAHVGQPHQHSHVELPEAPASVKLQLPLRKPQGADPDSLKLVDSCVAGAVHGVALSSP